MVETFKSGSHTFILPILKQNTLIAIFIRIFKMCRY